MKNVSIRRKIGLYMAAIMLFNLVVPFAAPSRAGLMASTVPPPISVESGGLAVHDANSTPMNVPLADATTAIGRENFHVYMQFGLTTNSTYRLRYPLAGTNHEVFLIIDVDDHGVANVTYDTTRTVPHGFQVYLAPMERRFMPILDYVRHPGRPRELDYRVFAYHPGAIPALNRETAPPGWPFAVWPPEGATIWPPAGWDPLLWVASDASTWPPAPPNWPTLPTQVPIWPPPVFVWNPVNAAGNGINPIPPPGWIGSPLDWPMALIATGWDVSNFDPTAVPPDHPMGPNALGSVPAPPGWPTAPPEWPQLPMSRGWPLLIPSTDVDPANYVPAFPPQFTLSNNRGFSFIYEGDFIHIRLDQTSGAQGSSNLTFHFAADNFPDGYLIDVVLERFNFGEDPSDPAVTSLAWNGVWVNTGITDVNVTPFANANPDYRDDTIDRFNTRERTMVIDRRPDAGNPRDNDVDRWPAQPDETLGMRLDFAVPVIAALQTGQGNIPPTELPGYIQFMEAGAAGSPFTLLINDLFEVDSNITITMPPSGLRWRPANPGAANDHPFTASGVGIRGGDLLTMDLLVVDPTGTTYRPGVMYGLGSQITLTPIEAIGPIPNPNIRVAMEPRPSPVAVGRNHPSGPFGPFTLINFDIVPINGLPHVRILSPFLQAGEYIVLEAPVPDFPMPGVGAQTDVILSRTHMLPAGAPVPLIPLRTDIYGQPRFVQVFFKPGDTFSDGTGGSLNELDFVRWNTANLWPVRSQGLWIEYDAETIAPRTVEFFNVTRERHVPDLERGLFERQRGLVDLRLDWQVGTQDVLGRLFENAARPDGTLDIYYQFNWSENPYSAEPDPAIEIRARMRQQAAVGTTTPAAIFVEYFLIEREWTTNPATGRPARGDIIRAIPSSSSESIGGIRFAPNAVHSPVLGFSSIHQWLAQVQLQVDTYHVNLGEPVVQPVTPTVNDPAGPQRGFNFPAIHFMNVQPVEVNGQERNTGFLTPNSEYSSFTLSDFEEYNVPPPQNLQAFNPVSENTALGDAYDRVSFDVSWDIHLPNIQEYLLMSYGLLLDPANEFSMEMRLFISQDEELMRREFADTNTSGAPRQIGDRLIISDRHLQRDAIVENYGDSIDLTGTGIGSGDTIYFSAIGSNPPTGGTDMREVLRGNHRDDNAEGIVAITGIEIDQSIWANVTSPASLGTDSVSVERVELRLDGLDRNQQYFVYADIIITQRLANPIPGRPGTGGGIEVLPMPIRFIVDSSMLSNLAGVTIPDDREVPDGIERDPMAPNLRVDPDSIGFSSAIIYWDRIQSIPTPAGYREELEYELIRIRNTQMSEDPEELIRLLNNRVPFEQVWTSLSEHSDIIAFETTTATTPSAIALAGINGRPAQPNMELILPIQTQPPGLDPIMVLDQTMDANTLYFFYARTVRTVYDASNNRVSRNYSVWSHVSVTTQIARAPRNLRRAAVDAIPNLVPNLQHEVIIEFEAPILHSSIQDLLGGGRIRIEYEIQVDDEGWNRRGIMRSPFLMANARPGTNEPPGWTWFLYHVTGLEAGRMHHIRVRLVEMDGNRVVSESMWSNVASWLTDGDPEEDEYNRLERDWLDYLRRRLQELLRYPYWIIRSDPGSYQVIFRNSAFNSIVAEARGGQIHLPFENARQTTYYIPIVSFTQAWDAELAFVITNNYGSMQLMIPSRAIDLHNNDVVVDVGASIRRREFEDYMIRFNVDWSNPSHIQGEETLTFAADVRFDLVSITQNIGAWEDQLLQSLIDRVDELATDEETVQFIRNAVRSDTPSEDISREMVRIVEQAARQALARVVGDNMRQLTARSRTNTIPRLDRSMAANVIGLQDLAAIEAYHSAGGSLWNNMPTMRVNDGEGIFTSQPGMFVFTGRSINIFGIEQVAGGPVATGVVARHGLDDFFGRGDMNVNQIATRSQLVSSAARMMGAPRGTDAVPWLRSNGVNITAAGMANPIEQQSAINLIMLVYEAQTGTRMDSLRITNFAIVNNLQGLEPRYRTSVAAAIELGLVDGHTFQPSAQMTVGELLEVLAALDRLIGL